MVAVVGFAQLFSVFISCDECAVPFPFTPFACVRAQGTYIDKKCPFTGQVSIRGRILKGIVVSTKMNRTIVIRRDYLRFVKKYRRFEKRHKTLSAHVSPAFRVKEGDVVTVGQCRCVCAKQCAHRDRAVPPCSLSDSSLLLLLLVAVLPFCCFLLM